MDVSCDSVAVAAAVAVVAPLAVSFAGLRLPVIVLEILLGIVVGRVPLLLAALLVVRAVPALVYRPLADRASQVVWVAWPRNAASPTETEAAWAS